MSENGKGFIVNDRRRFDEGGNERDSSTESIKSNDAPESKVAAAPQPKGITPDQKVSKPAAEQVPSGDREFVLRDEPKSGPGSLSGGVSPEDSDLGRGAHDAGSAPVLSFSSFVMSLATQALIQMGEIEPPGGLKLPPDFEAAKQSIEIIGMLAIKTKGNLDPEEQRLLAEVLHSIRLTFVQRVKTAIAAAGVNPEGVGPRANPK